MGLFSDFSEAQVTCITFVFFLIEETTVVKKPQSPADRVPKFCTLLLEASHPQRELDTFLGRYLVKPYQFVLQGKSVFLKIFP